MIHRFLPYAAAAALWLISAGMPPAACAEDSPLTIFYASTLAGFVHDVVRAFRQSHPEVEVRGEASGSLDAIRKVTDLHRSCDILLSADWRLLDRPIAGVAPWTAIFAGNAMAILYSRHSKYADEINAANWRQILARPGVRYGHSDPGRDPEGYWTLILWRLAERYYLEPGLAARLKAGCPPENVRPASVNLIALIQSGDLDYYFGYASDARLGNLRALVLPPQLNLSDFQKRAEYAAVSVKIRASAGTETVSGAPIAYGAAMASDPSNREAALGFLRLLLGPEGRTAAERNGLIPYSRAFAIDRKSTMPPVLKGLIVPFSGG